VEEGDPHIIVGTVGTLFNMVKKRNFKGKDIDLIVVDEADKVLFSQYKRKMKLVIGLETLHIALT